MTTLALEPNEGQRILLEFAQFIEAHRKYRSKHGRDIFTFEAFEDDEHVGDFMTLGKYSSEHVRAAANQIAPPTLAGLAEAKQLAQTWEVSAEQRETHARYLARIFDEPDYAGAARELQDAAIERQHAAQLHTALAALSEH